jgi:hypothetical protein
MISIKTEFENSEFNYDRTLNDKDILPYTKEYFIQPNELSYYKSFNIKLSYLYDNLLYIYGRCFIPNFKIPTTFTGFIGVTGNNLGIYNDPSISNPFANAGFPNIDIAKNAVVYKKDDSYYFFINCLSAINVLRYNGENNFCQACPNILSTVDPISGELKFQKINDIAISENKHLIVSDEILDIVYKYDLETYFSDENIFKSPTAPFGNKLFLKDSVGGQGGRYNTIKFEKPKNLTTYNDLVLVEDYDNKIWKLYNSNLNFISYKTFLSLYKSISSFQNIKFKNESEIYGITKDGYYLFDLNNENYQINLNSFYSLSSVLYDNETVLDIEFCNYEKDIIYILTDKALIKKWSYLENGIIGRKSASDFGNLSEFKWMSSAIKNLSSENIYIYFYNSTANANQILIYNDELDLFSIFEKNDFEIYSKDEISIKKEEWNQAWVYEKNLKKIVKNLDILKNNIYYNLIKKEGDFGSIVDVRKIYNKFVFESAYLDYKREFVIGVNENFQSSVLNRELEKVYGFQKQTLDFVLIDNNLNYEENIDIPSPTPTPTITPTITPTVTPTATPVAEKGVVTFVNEGQIFFFNGQPLSTFP